MKSAMNVSIGARSKVLVLASTFPRWSNDSEPRFVLDLCKALMEKADVVVLAPHCRGAKFNEYIEGVKVNRFRYAPSRLENLAYNGGMLSNIRGNHLNALLLPFFFLGMVFASIKLLRRYDFSVIHAHWLIPQGFIAAVARIISRTEIPLVITCHGADLYTLEKRPWSWLKRWALKSCDGVTVVSSAMKDQVNNVYHMPDRLIKVLPMGVDLTQIFVPDTNKFQRRKGLLFVGRLVEKKGVQYLIEAVDRLIRRNVTAHLTIVGDGPARETLEAQARFLGVSAYISFVGAVEQSELPSFYQRHSAAVFPFVVAENGDQEGLGLVVIEAQGCGCPVIASDLPALHDSFLPELHTWLVPPGNSDILADKIELLLSLDTLETQQLAIKARNHALSRFDRNLVKKEYLKILRIPA